VEIAHALDRNVKAAVSKYALDEAGEVLRAQLDLDADLAQELNKIFRRLLRRTGRLGRVDEQPEAIALGTALVAGW
jgi:hypothetical protein